jgi:hypothetical protein
MIDTTTIDPNDTPLDHLAKTRILLMEMHHDFHQYHEMNCEQMGEDAEHKRIHDLIRHNTITAEKLGADINQHPLFKTWQTGYDRVHNPDAPYLRDLDA